jgi:hypothetical protein
LGTALNPILAAGTFMVAAAYAVFVQFIDFGQSVHDLSLRNSSIVLYVMATMVFFYLKILWL